MSGRVDQTGKRFGRLVVVRFVGVVENWIGMWECVCDCGNVLNVRYNNLQSGTTKSCGCLKLEKIVQRSTKHGLTGGHGNYTRLYRIWLNMRRRCFNKKSCDYHHYGGRGITVCKDWNDYEKFYLWANSHGYSDKLTLERKNVNGNYEPDNCCWATRKEQARNTRVTKFITFDGETKSLHEWADDIGILANTLTMRIRRGWSLERALKSLN